MQPEKTVRESFEQEIPAPRGGCLTAWLVFVMVVGSLGAVVSLLNPDVLLRSAPGYSRGELYLLGAADVANVVFAVLIWNWRRVGFWGLIVTALVAFGINFSAHIGLAAYLGLIGPVILALLVRPHWARLK